MRPLWQSSPAPQCPRDVHGQIVEMSQRIEKDPKNPELYLSRRRTLPTHPGMDRRNADYDRAFALKPLESSILPEAECSGANWLLSAKITLIVSLQTKQSRRSARHSGENPKPNLRCVLKRQGLHLAINLCTEQRSELYYERAQALARSNTYARRQSRGSTKALRKLATGYFGAFAIDIEVKDKQYDTALARLDTMAAKSPRKETWLAARSDILFKQEKIKKRESIPGSPDAMETLPPARKNFPPCSNSRAVCATNSATLSNNQSQRPRATFNLQECCLKCKVLCGQRDSATFRA